MRWDGTTLGLNLPGLALGGLDLSGVSGRLTATGSVKTATLDGSAHVGLENAQTGITIPVLNLPLTGDVSADVTLSAGRLKADAQLSAPYGNGQRVTEPAGERGRLHRHAASPGAEQRRHAEEQPDAERGGPERHAERHRPGP